MQRLVVAIFMMMIALVAATASQSSTYLGSFSNTRASESGHVYTYEFRLWQSEDTLHGVILVIQGLQGGGIPPLAEKITVGRLSQPDRIEIETKWYSFVGTYSSGELKGKLRQGSEVVWGGIENSEEIVLKKGTHIAAVPEKELKSIKEVDAWASQLK